MAQKDKKMPRSASSLKIRAAVKKLQGMPLSDRVQLMVQAGLMTQAEADAAKLKLSEAATQP